MKGDDVVIPEWVTLVHVVGTGDITELGQAKLMLKQTCDLLIRLCVLCESEDPEAEKVEVTWYEPATDFDLA